MENERSVYGVSAENLARILALGTDSSDAGAAAEGPAELLGKLLSTAPPDEPGGTIRERLLGADPGAAELSAVKDHAKKLARRRKPEAASSSATAVYYAAIAAALVRHGRKISQHSYAKLEKAFARLHGEPWVGRDLKKLFAGARDICRQRRPRSD